MDKRKQSPPGDDCEIRCPRLGHPITFSYCRAESLGLPCIKILDCWYDQFLVEEYLRRELKPEQWDRVFNRPRKPKVLSLVELIEEAKRSGKK